MSSADTNIEIERNRNAYPEIPVYFFKVLTYCDYVFTTIFAFEVVVKVSVLVVDCTITRNADVGVTWVWRGCDVGVTCMDMTWSMPMRLSHRISRYPILLSHVSQKIKKISTKWRIYKGNWTRPKTFCWKSKTGFFINWQELVFFAKKLTE